MVNKIVLKYGLLLFVGLLSYFAIMQVFGLSQNYDFRVLNAIIQTTMIYLAVRKYAKEYRSDFNYLSGTLVGISTTVVGVLPFAIFQMINLVASPALLEHIQANAPVVGPYLSPFTAGLIVLVEGLAVGLVLSYLTMRIVDAQQPSFTKAS